MGLTFRLNRIAVIEASTASRFSGLVRQERCLEHMISFYRLDLAPNRARNRIWISIKTPLKH
jgi:hypothetical protein